MEERARETIASRCGRHPRQQQQQHWRCVRAADARLRSGPLIRTIFNVSNQNMYMCACVCVYIFINTYIRLCIHIHVIFKEGAKAQSDMADI
jgi:hypothetical protein